MLNSISINFDTPKRSLRSALGLIVIVAFSWLLFVGYLIPGFREIFELKPETVTMSSIVLMGIPIISYLLIGTTVALVVNIFRPLKPVSEEGLIMSLVVGLVWGIVVGSVGGLVFGLIWGLVWGLVFGLVATLIVGLALGLESEFN